MPNTIVLKGRGIRKEALAAGAITPGMLIERTSTGTVQAHGTAAANAVTSFAVEAEVVGRDLTDAYAATDTVFYEVCHAGQEVNALIGITTVTNGDFVESAGDGTVRTVAADAATDQGQRAAVVGQALETVVNGASTARCKIEVI